MNAIPDPGTRLDRTSHGGDSLWPFHPLVGGHLTIRKGALNHPKKVIKNCQVGGGFNFFYFHPEPWGR